MNYLKMTREILRGATLREIAIGVLAAIVSLAIPLVIIYLLVVYGGLR